MSDYTMAQAKRDFERGLISGGRIEAAVLVEGWNVVLTGGGYEGYLVNARNPSLPRFFCTADAAIRALRAVGFRADIFQAMAGR